MYQAIFENFPYLLFSGNIWGSGLIPGVFSTVIQDLLQLFSSEASAQSMTWLHQAELGTQLPSLHDDSDEPHVTSAGRGRGVGVGYLHFKKIAEAALADSCRYRSEQCLQPSFRGRL